MHITITFEVPEGTTAEQLHEALCLAAHEGDTEQLAALVQDIAVGIAADPA